MYFAIILCEPRLPTEILYYNIMYNVIVTLCNYRLFFLKKKNQPHLKECFLYIEFSLSLYYVV